MSRESGDGVRSSQRYADSYRAWYRSAAEIRAEGAIGSLMQGIEVEIHGVSTRIIAWPGNGFQTESIHVLTLSPGQEMEMHAYGMAEEAMICLKGGGEAYVRGEWVPLNPGDLAFYPPNVPHAVRAAASAERDLVMVTAISPPAFDLYADAGFYNVQYGVINEEAAFFAHQNAVPGTLSPEQEMRYWDTAPGVRPWNLSVEEIVSGGALFTIFRGAKIDVIDAPMVFVLWPGYGARSTGFHFATGEAGLTTAVHAHPAADECVVMWGGGPASAYCADDGPSWTCTTACSPRVAPGTGSAASRAPPCGAGSRRRRSWTYTGGPTGSTTVSSRRRPTDSSRCRTRCSPAARRRH
jgi:quercetin dioxygenase-like cupin family protein